MEVGLVGLSLRMVTSTGMLRWPWKTTASATRRRSTTIAGGSFTIHLLMTSEPFVDTLWPLAWPLLAETDASTVVAWQIRVIVSQGDTVALARTVMSALTQVLEPAGMVSGFAAVISTSEVAPPAGGVRTSKALVSV